MAKALTNREVAEYFTKLSPDESASLVMVNEDLDTADNEYLYLTTEELVKDIRPEVDVGVLCVRMKW